MANKATFNKVGYTAVWTAYLRSFSDIPYAKELYRELSRAEYGKESAELQKPAMAPQYEARYKILTKLLLGTKIGQILELAAGFTGRGLALTNELSVSYVELEIPSVVAEKHKIIERIQHQKPVGQLRLVAGDALRMDDLRAATTGFDAKRPIAVLNEGLMRYLTFPEKTTLAKNTHALLSEYGGVWITPDISLATLLGKEDKAIVGHTDKLTAITGKDVRGNLFESIDHAQKFFGELGFSVERHSLLEVTDELVSSKQLNISPEEVENMNAPATVFVMRVRRS